MRYRADLSRFLYRDHSVFERRFFTAAIRQRIVQRLVTTERIGGHSEPDNAVFCSMVKEYFKTCF